MMKTLTHSLASATLIALAVLISCNKERHETAPETIDTVENLVLLANQAYLSAEIIGGDEQSSFFVSNEGLIDEYLACDTRFGSPEKTFNNRFIGCLRSIGLEEGQIPLTQRALRAYETRNEKIVQRHRQAFVRLHERIEAKRNALLRQLNNGQIDRNEFRRQITQLREQYRQGLRSIKETNADAFSRSYRMMLQQLRNILDEDQWEIFTTCLRS
jgi:hypothetical protein